ILPNTLAPLIVQVTTSFPVAVLAEAGLAYLGLGTQPPQPSWGSMLKDAQNFLALNPSFALFPGAAIALTVLGLNLLADGLRDLLDPEAVSGPLWPASQAWGGRVAGQSLRCRPG